MKKFWKSLALLLCLLAGFGFVVTGCSDGDDDGGSSGGGGSTPVVNDPSGVVIPELTVTDTYSLSAGTKEAAYEDASLYIKFDSAPTINAAQSVKGDAEKTKAVKIRKSDGTVVDTIYASKEQIVSQASNAAYYNINVQDQLISVNGNVVVIKRHPNIALAASTQYYVTVDAGLFTGKVNGTDFAGISDATTFTFTTRAAPVISGTEITIGKDKNFSTIQAAFDYLAANAADDSTWKLNIDKGYYNERLSFAKAKVNVEMIGSSDADNKLGAKTVIYWKNNNGKDGTANEGWNPSSRSRTAFLYEGNNLTVKHLTFANTIDRKVVGKDGTQAEAFYYDAKGYLVAYDCSFKSHQDTLLLGNQGGRGWFYKCYIEGDTDFIWGYPDVVLFEECDIRCLYDYAPAVTNHTSYIFASRAMQNDNANKGLVLFNSNVKVDNGVTAYFGRNSGSDTQAAVVFNKFSSISPTLWYDGATKYDEDIESVCTVGYKDYGNTDSNGAVLSTASRKEGTYGLSKYVAEREYCGRNAILNRGWNATSRKYEATTVQWDLSALETEFSATEDKSKSMLYLEPTYIPYLEGKASSSAFVVKNYKGEVADGLTFSVDKAELATVSDAGVVTAKENQDGELLVTATKGTQQGIARVIILKQFVPATGLAFDKTAAFDIDKDDSVTLTAAFTPAETTDKNIIWTSSNTNVLRVQGSGATGKGLSATVTGFGVGTATITATSEKTPSVSTSITITVKEVYAARYLQESTGYNLNASIDHRDATIVANPVSYGFAGGVEVATLTDADKGWGNNGYKFMPVGEVDCQDGADFAWADFTIRAAGSIKLKAVTANLYSSSTSNLRGKVYVKVGDGEFVAKGEAAAESKAMKFTKQDISTDVEAGKTVTIRLAIAMLAGKTQKKVTDGVIGGVVIYYDITGTPVAFPGADGDYNIIDYATAAEKTAQGTAIADGKSADGMVSWHNVTYHSDGYGLQILGNKDATITVKVGGPSVISMVSSTYSAGTITVKNKAGNVIASGSTKVDTDKTPFSFLYTGSVADELTVAFSGSTSYIGKINVRELTTEKAEIKSVKINGAETVSTATTDGVKFTAAVEATYMASPEVTWSSEDETIATVSSEGLVKGLKAGKTKINAVSKLDATKKDSFEITVTEDEVKPVAGTTYTYNFKDKSTPVTDATAGSSSDTFLSWNDKWKYHGASYGIVNTSKAGATLSIKVAGDVVVGFTGYNAASGVMKVTDANGAVVLESMPMKTGSDATTKEFIYKGAATTLTLTSVSGDCYISTLTVKPWTNEVAAVTAVSVSGAGSVAVGQTVTLKADVTATYFANSAVTWASGNTSIATVDENGVVTGVAAGDVTITATSVNNPGISGSKTVKISADANNPIYGYTYAYTLTGGKGTPYTSDDGFLKVTASGDNGGHGLIMKDGNTIVLKVAGAGTVSIGTCAYDKACTITVTNGAGTILGTISVPAGDGTNDNTTQEFAYTGTADTLTFTYSAGNGGQYLHGVKFTPASNSVTYTLTGGKGTPYTSDDGFLKVTASGDNGGHGLIMKDGNTIVLKVAGAGTVSIGTCAYDKACTITVTNGAGTILGTISVPAGDGTNDNTTQEFAYTGTADTLTFTYSAGNGGQYLHSVKVTY